MGPIDEFPLLTFAVLEPGYRSAMFSFVFLGPWLDFFPHYFMRNFSQVFSPYIGTSLGLSYHSFFCPSGQQIVPYLLSLISDS